MARKSRRANVPVFSSLRSAPDLLSRTAGLVGLPSANPLCLGIASTHLVRRNDALANTVYQKSDLAQTRSTAEKNLTLTAHRHDWVPHPFHLQACSIPSPQAGP
jgi:hypothetical protein